MKPPTKLAGLPHASAGAGPRPKPRRTVQAVLAAAVAIAAPAGCFALGEGLEPPPQRFYYPTALLTSPGQHTLYVVNSDFDIQYTGGTVQALDLDVLRKCTGRLALNLSRGSSAENACQDIGLALNDKPAIVPGPCAPIQVDAEAFEDDTFVACTLTDDPDTTEVEGAVRGPVISESRIIGAFASSATLTQNPSVDPASGEAEARLFVAVRGDPSITFFNTTQDATDTTTDPQQLDCFAEGGDQGVGESCTSRSRIGVFPNESSRLLTLPVEPVGIAASDDGSALVAVHETEAAASLIVNKWGSKPTLEFTLGGLPDAPSDVAAIPTAGYIAAVRGSGASVDYRPGFLVTYRAARQVDLLRFYDDSDGTSRHFLQRIDAFSIVTNSDGSDSRGIAVLDTERRACEASCDPADLACLRGCIDVPLQVFIANRAPASLLIGELETEVIEVGGAITGVIDKLNINEMVPLTSGPSRVGIGNVLDGDGKPSPRVFAVSFDSRFVVIYDPAQHRIEAAVHTGRGPHALAFDLHEKTATSDGSAFLYVAHFTDSYIGVVDLDTRHAKTYGSMFAAVGQHTPPKDN